MLFKKGDPNLPENYRGIALLNNLCKKFFQILYNRLKTWLEDNNLLKQAFDTVNRSKLWDKLYQIGKSSKFIRNLQNFYIFL